MMTLVKRIAAVALLLVGAAALVQMVRRPPLAADGRTVITWLVPMQLDRPLLEKLAVEFAKENPDIDLRMTFVPGAQYQPKLKTLIAAGHPPDLFYCGDVWVAYYEPFLLDLTPYFERDRQLVDLDDIYPAVLRACQTDGRYLFAPRWFSVALLYYNRTIFDRADEPYPTSDWTWDDYLATAKRLTRPAGDGGPAVWGSQIITGWWGEWLTLVRQSGGELFNEDMTRCTLDTPAAIAGMQRYIDKVHTHRISPPPGFGPDQGFASGRLAMELVGHTGNWTQFNQVGLNWDIALLPAGPTPVNRSEVAIEAIGVSKDTRQPEACWRLLRFMMSKPAIRAHVEAGYLSIRTSVAEETLLAEGFLRHPQNIRAAYDALAIADHGAHSPDFIEIALEVIQPEIDRALISGTNIDAHCRRATRAANDFLSTLGTERRRNGSPQAAQE